ncbi:MAG: ABC transporter substrate-binding protein [Alphaproteobacteria bacterium]|nr:ABC transporter substrate-binding protein [Alphaproteobacteria bacterium]
MSLKICTDELLLDLVPTSRIASVTFLSREPAALRIWPQGAKVPVNHGTAEEILAIHPDLILTDPFMAPSLRPLLAKNGARILEVPPADNFEQIRLVTRIVAKAVGEEARGEALIARMDADLADVAAHRPKKALVVAGWGGGGYVPGKGGLFNTMLTMAGARNVVSGNFGYYDVESLIEANPDALVYGDTYRGMASLRADQDLHPALLKRYGGRRISYTSLYGCGVPESGRVTRSLQDALLKVRR